MCIGCRKRQPKDAMIRLTIDSNDTVQTDFAETNGGRGAWLCANPRCLDKALRKNGFRQAFRRTPCQTPHAELLQKFGEGWTARAQRRLQRARRVGAMRPIMAVDGTRMIHWGTPPKAWEVTDDGWLNELENVIAQARDWHEMAAGSKHIVSTPEKNRC